MKQLLLLLLLLVVLSNNVFAQNGFKHLRLGMTNKEFVRSLHTSTLDSIEISFDRMTYHRFPLFGVRGSLTITIDSNKLISDFDWASHPTQPTPKKQLNRALRECTKQFGKPSFRRADKEKGDYYAWVSDSATYTLTLQDRSITFKTFNRASSKADGAALKVNGSIAVLKYDSLYIRRTALENIFAGGGTLTVKQDSTEERIIDARIVITMTLDSLRSDSLAIRLVHIMNNGSHQDCFPNVLHGYAIRNGLQNSWDLYRDPNDRYESWAGGKLIRNGDDTVSGNYRTRGGCNVSFKNLRLQKQRN